MRSSPEGHSCTTFDEEIDRLIHSGAIDFEEDIGAARMVLVAAMENTLTHFGPIVTGLGKCSTTSGGFRCLGIKCKSELTS